MPERVLADVAVFDPDPEALTVRARTIGARQLAVPAYAVDELDAQVAFAADVVSRLRVSGT